MFFKIILFVFELVCAFEILNKSNCTSVGETQGRYSLLVVYHFFFFFFLGAFKLFLGLMPQRMTCLHLVYAKSLWKKSTSLTKLAT